MMEYLKFTAAAKQCYKCFLCSYYNKLYSIFSLKKIPKPKNAFLHIKNASIYLIGPSVAYKL